MSKVWSYLLIICIVFSIFMGNSNEITNSIITNGKKSVENVLEIISMMCFWSGIFKILENTSIITKISEKMSKYILKIFDKNELSENAKKYISLNIVSNLLGIGNASTINGIKAMKEMSKYSKKGIASNNMTKFVLINTASIQLFPTSMIALRTLYKSNNPTCIIIPIIIISFIALIGGLIMISFLNQIIKEE